MRAIISDIHANLTALHAVLEDIARFKVEDIVCLGDIVGYGPCPVECVDLIRKRCQWCICGNHDAALFMSTPIGFNRLARQAVEWHKSRLIPGFWGRFSGKSARWKYLENLPLRLTEDHVLYVHGSPRDPIMEYVEESDLQDLGFGPAEKVLEWFANTPWVCFVGHSHRPGVVTPDFQFLKPTDLDDMSYTLSPDKKAIINIGSVGQPRDMNPDSCYVLLDGMTVRYRRVRYDVEAVKKQIAAIPQLDARLGVRLELGK